MGHQVGLFSGVLGRIHHDALRQRPVSVAERLRQPSASGELPCVHAHRLGPLTVAVLENHWRSGKIVPRPLLQVTDEASVERHAGGNQRDEEGRSEQGDDRVAE